MALQRYRFEVNGLTVPAVFEDAAVEGIFRPLIDRLFAMKAEMDGPLVVFLAGPPGCGKSTLALLLERLADERAPGRLQALGMDGFHHTRAYIAEHTAVRGGAVVPMAKVKGSPESFDIEKLTSAIRSLRDRPVRWPAYDRRLHDVVEAATEVSSDILLVEGNWLLLDEPGFSALRALCDYSVALYAEEVLLKDRLIARKRMGGASEREAGEHYRFCDRDNILRYARGTRRGDLNLRMIGDGDYEAL